ncbi:MAG TPA: nucleotidyltransferase domain-containing protein [Bacillota bacterium]|nr:nucleotidyltransferase domain-containing protein [Bacillota bacterium]HPJ23498.1 nucleotidyltransferase domain-containing protein [Bacillota bacterium]
MNIKELRKSKKLTQKEASEFVNIPLRTYKNYENDNHKAHSIKYDYIMEKLTRYGYIDEDHGVLNIDDIQNTCKTLFDKYDIDYCYLFGSYAKGNAHEKSDVDLLVSTSITGMNFFGLVEELRVQLKKRVELLTIDQLYSNSALVNEILKDGIKIYG